VELGDEDVGGDVDDEEEGGVVVGGSEVVGVTLDSDDVVGTGVVEEGSEVELSDDDGPAGSRIDEISFSKPPPCRGFNKFACARAKRIARSEMNRI